jgi:hypothetical protein
MPATGLLNEAMQDLKATLTAVTGLRVVSDPTKIVPNCVFLDAPSFETIAGGGNIVRVTIPVRVIGSGTAAQNVLENILSIVATVLGSRVVIMAGQPSSLEIGGATYPAYDLQMAMQAQKQ